MQRITHPGVGCDAIVGIIRSHPVLVKTNVLEQCTKPNGLVDFRFTFGTEVDGFGVTPPFHVEDPIRRPSVFIVSNQCAVGIAAQRGFPRA